jgi:DNA invertase Pin-like site-specific DNA recombinase
VYPYTSISSSLQRTYTWLEIPASCESSAVSTDFDIWHLTTSLDGKPVEGLIAYVRVSTSKQAVDGTGLQAQLNQLQAFADRLGLPILRVFQDIGSAARDGGLDLRRGWNDALRESRDRKVPIAVADSTRVTRSKKDFEKLCKQPDAWVIDTSLPRTPEDEARMAARIARGQNHASLIRHRTKEALRARKQMGVPLGNRINLRKAQSLGAAKNKTLAQERDSVLEGLLMELAAKGIKTRAKFAEELNRIGYAAPQGGKWTANNLKRPLRRIKERRSPSEVDHPSWGTW